MNPLMPETRKADCNDAGTISSIVSKKWKAVYRGMVDDAYLDALTENSWETYLGSALKKGSLFSIVMEEGGTPIGVAILGETEYRREVELVSLCLLPGFAGKGLGRRLYREAEAFCRRMGYTSCVHDVIEGDAGAVAFYRKLGFSVTRAAFTAVFDRGLAAFGGVTMRKYYAGT